MKLYYQHIKMTIGYILKGAITWSGFGCRFSMTLVWPRYGQLWSLYERF